MLYSSLFMIGLLGYIKLSVGGEEKRNKEDISAVDGRLDTKVIRTLWQIKN